MIIREYQRADCKEITELFYNMIHMVNAKEYVKKLLDVWITGEVNLEKWNQLFREHHSIVAVEDGVGKSD